MASVRRASHADIQLILFSIRALAAYICCLIADYLGSSAGFALYHLNYPT
jgi:hypothetical protein